MSPENDTPEKEVAQLKEELCAKDEEIAKLRELISDQWQAEAPADSGEDDSDERGNDAGEVTLADILANPEVTKAVNTAVEAWAQTQPDAMKLKFRSLHLGIAFSCLVLIVIG